MTPSQLDSQQAPLIQVDGSWKAALASSDAKVDARDGALSLTPTGSLGAYLAGYFQRQRWFRSKARSVLGVSVTDVFDLGSDAGNTQLLFCTVVFASGEPEIYVLTVRFVADSTAPETAPPHDRRLARILGSNGSQPIAGWLVDAGDDPQVAMALLQTVAAGGEIANGRSRLRGVPAPLLSDINVSTLRVRPVGVEQSNTSYVFGTTLIAKMVRKVEAGESIELELLRQLAHAGGANVPMLAGHLEVISGQDGHSETADSPTLLIAETFAPNRGDAWAYVGTEVSAFYQRVLRASATADLGVPEVGSLLSLIGKRPEGRIGEFLGEFPTMARLLGQRTAELHRALASSSHPGFKPETWSHEDRGSLGKAVGALAKEMLDLARQKLPSLPSGSRALADQILSRETEILARLQEVEGNALGGQRIRIHGDYHLGQVLFTGTDFVIIDFEGEPARSIEWRRQKRSPIVDVAGMLRSFHYAAVFGLISEDAPVRAADRPYLEPWAQVWNAWIGAAFLEGYLETLGGSELVPNTHSSLALLLNTHLMEKALYEVGYELNNRPSWASIPLRGVVDVLDSTRRVN